MNLEFNKNDDAMRLAVSQMKQRHAVISLGGGKKSMEKAREKGKMAPRERIQYLIDKGSVFTEIGAFTGYDMYKEHGGCPAGGTVAGLGYIHGRQCVIVANDNTVKAGAWFPITGKKNLRMQEIAMENHLPIIYIVDSAGVYLPMQDEIFPDKEHFGRIFRNNAQMSAMGITQIAAVMGSCVAGGAYLPIMSDETLMVEGNGSIFLAGPYLVKAAIGEDIDIQTLGGAKTHTEISGIADYKFDTEQECLDQVRRIMDKVGEQPRMGYDRVKPVMPLKEASEIYGLVSPQNNKHYDVVDVIAGEPSMIICRDDMGDQVRLRIDAVPAGIWRSSFITYIYQHHYESYRGWLYTNNMFIIVPFDDAETADRMAVKWMLEYG